MKCLDLRDRDAAARVMREGGELEGRRPDSVGLVGGCASVRGRLRYRDVANREVRRGGVGAGGGDFGREDVNNVAIIGELTSEGEMMTSGEEGRERGEDTVSCLSKVEVEGVTNGVVSSPVTDIGAKGIFSFVLSFKGLSE